MELNLDALQVTSFEITDPTSPFGVADGNNTIIIYVSDCVSCPVND